MSGADEGVPAGVAGGVIVAHGRDAGRGTGAAVGTVLAADGPDLATPRPITGLAEAVHTAAGALYTSAHLVEDAPDSTVARHSAAAGGAGDATVGVAADGVPRPSGLAAQLLPRDGDRDRAGGVVDATATRHEAPRRAAVAHGPPALAVPGSGIAATVVSALRHPPEPVTARFTADRSLARGVRRLAGLARAGARGAVGSSACSARDREARVAVPVPARSALALDVGALDDADRVGLVAGSRERSCVSWWTGPRGVRGPCIGSHTDLLWTFVRVCTRRSQQEEQEIPRVCHVASHGSRRHGSFSGEGGTEPSAGRIRSRDATFTGAYRIARGRRPIMSSCSGRT